jgi:hypothetical protein
MDIVKENIVKFIDCIIVEDYSKAHSFLEVVINEKVKSRIKKAAKQNPFVKGAEKSSKESAFGGKFPQAKSKKHKKKLVSEEHSTLIKLMDELPDGSNAASAIFHFKDYYDGQWSAMYKVMSSGRIRVDDLYELSSEISEAKQIAEKNGDLEVADDFEQLLKELDRIQQKYTPQEENI